MSTGCPSFGAFKGFVSYGLRTLLHDEADPLARLIVPREVAEQHVLACLEREGEPSGLAGLDDDLPHAADFDRRRALDRELRRREVRLQHDQLVLELARVAHAEDNSPA